MLTRFGRALSALRVPAYWPALARGVVPGFEHGSVFAGQEFLTVIDVGANSGQFATFARHRWPGARLICFEPLPGPRRQLEALLRGRAEVHPVALGSEPGRAEMHVASRADSSSILPLGEAQKRLFSMEEAQVLSVPVERLDSVVLSGEVTGPALLKIDVQGFEFEVLQGATDLLDVIDAIYVECSFMELYVGQRLAGDVIDMVKELGFAEAGSFHPYFDEAGAKVQADLLFKRSKPLR
jgi:FkbM family methyltransferase